MFRIPLSVGSADGLQVRGSGFAVDNVEHTVNQRNNQNNDGYGQHQSPNRSGGHVHQVVELKCQHANDGPDDCVNSTSSSLFQQQNRNADEGKYIQEENTADLLMETVLVVIPGTVSF